MSKRDKALVFPLSLLFLTAVMTALKGLGVIQTLAYLFER